MQKQFLNNPTRQFESLDEFGNNARQRKNLSKRVKQDKQNASRETHVIMTRLGVPRRKDGNKLGIRKREELSNTDFHLS